MASQNRQASQDRKGAWAFSGAFIRKAGMAALVSLSVFFLIVYVNTGRIIPWQGDAWPGLLTELGLFFLLLLAVLWSHARIAALMRRPGLQALPSSLRAVIEAALVAGATLLFNYTFVLLPIFYLLDIGEPPEGRVRTVLVISGAISLFFYYFIERERGRKRLQAELLRSEQLQKENFRAQLDALKAQMHPHFLFNSLSVLASLVQADPDRAYSFTRELAQVYRSFLDNSGKALVPLREEMELLQAYLSLLQTRFDEGLQANITIPEAALRLQLPPGALQLLVENAIKHNGFNARRPLYIQIFLEGDKVVVKNNRQARQEAPQSSGHGLENIRGRYRLLTEEVVEVVKTEEAFVVKLPLVE